MKIKPQEIDSRQDSVLCHEYSEYMKTGATNIEALVQVAVTNELEVITVFNALVRAEQSDLHSAPTGD
jgi:hypothetical protein